MHQPGSGTQATFDSDWDRAYRDGLAINKYPWAAVISSLFRARRIIGSDSSRQLDLVEVGCGTGNNIVAAATEGFTVAGLDGSAAAIEIASRFFEQRGLRADLRVGDFSDLPWAAGSFDIALDRGAITCAPPSAARRAIDELHRVLRPGGLAICIDIFSTQHSAAVFADAQGFASEIPGDHLGGVRQATFYDWESVTGLFAPGRWDVIAAQETLIKSKIPNPDFYPAAVSGQWQVIAQRL